MRNVEYTLEFTMARTPRPVPATLYEAVAVVEARGRDHEICASRTCHALLKESDHGVCPSCGAMNPLFPHLVAEGEPEFCDHRQCIRLDREGQLERLYLQLQDDLDMRVTDHRTHSRLMQSSLKEQRPVANRTKASAMIIHHAIALGAPLNWSRLFSHMSPRVGVICINHLWRRGVFDAQTLRRFVVAWRDHLDALATSKRIKVRLRRFAAGLLSTFSVQAGCVRHAYSAGHGFNGPRALLRRLLFMSVHQRFILTQGMRAIPTTALGVSRIRRGPLPLTRAGSRPVAMHQRVDRQPSPPRYAPLRPRHSLRSAARNRRVRRIGCTYHCL